MKRILLALTLTWIVVVKVQAVQCPHPKVLLTGGTTDLQVGTITNSAELYDPSTRTFTATMEPMVSPRAGQIAVRLPNGNVLIAGGVATSGGAGLNTAEVYQVKRGIFISTGGMLADRIMPLAVSLQSGNVLIVGGASVAGSPQTSGEVYNWRKRTFASAGDLLMPRADSAALLPNGEVLVTSGTAGELFNPATQSFTQTKTNMTTEHDNATLLANGRVLVAGNTSLLSQPADLYDWKTDSFAPTQGAEPFAMSATTATRLNNRRVVFIGGFAFRYEATRIVTYRPRPETFDESSLGLTAPRVQHTATKLPNGMVLVAGGWACFLGCPGDEHYTAWDTAEIYDPTTGVSTQTGNMTSPRFGHTATLVCP